MPSELESWNHSKVIQVSNLAMTCTKEQIRTLFGYLGRLDEVRMYPAEDSPIPATSKVFYVKFDDPVTTGVACHLTNTVFIDRALVIVPVLDGKIPDEQTALQISAPGASQPGQPVMGTPNWPQDIINQTTGIGLNQVHTTYDPKLAAMGLPQYPPLTGSLDPHKVEEIRRTIYITKLDQSVTTDMLLTFFSQIGEVKYVRMAGEESQLIRCAFVEFSEISTVATALTYNGVTFAGKPLKIAHANNAIIKPGASAMMPSREMEEAMKKVKEAQSLITSAVETDLGKRSRSRSRSRRRRSRSRSRRRSRSRSKGRARRSRSKNRRSTSRTRKTRSPRRRRSRSRHRSRSRSKERKRRDDKDRKRERDRSRTRRSRRSRSGSRKEPPPVTDMRERKRSRSRSKHRRRSRSRSPAKKPSKSPSPPKIERIRSLSPKRKGSSRSPSPLKKSKSRRSRSKSRSPRKSSSSRHKKEKRRDRDHDSRERESKSKKRKDKDKERDRDRDRDRDRERDHSGDRKDGEQKEVKIKRDYDEEEKGYDSDKSEERKAVHVEESKPEDAGSGNNSSDNEEKGTSKPAATDDLQEMDMDVDSD